MSTIDDVLEKWEECKKNISHYEKESEKYKQAVQNYMNKKDKNTITGNYYTISRRNNTREQLSKSNIPIELWSKYCNRFSYVSYHLKKNK